MEQKIQFIILGLVALLATSLFIIFRIQNSRLELISEYNVTKQRLNQQEKDFANRLDKTLAENRTLQGRLEAIQQELERISQEKDELQRKYELVNQERHELLGMSEEYVKLQEDLESFKNENKILKEKIDILQKDKFAFNDLRRNNESLKQKIEEAKQILKEKAILASKAKETQPSAINNSDVKSVQLPPIVVSPQVSSDESSFPSGDASSSPVGRILNVNSKYNFVVIDLGYSMGIKEGMMFRVFRGNNLLGRIKTIQMRREIAACDILQADMPFKIGDTVRY